MGVKREGDVVSQLAGAPVVGAAEAGAQKSGTIDTPNGPITWTRDSVGTVNAQGGGQTFTATCVDQSDGSSERRVLFARNGEAPYLSVEAAVHVGERSVDTWIEARKSRVGLVITQIAVRATSAPATVTGTYAGLAIKWSGTVDLTSNPFVGRPVPGWPQGSFEAQFHEAAFFLPLTKSFLAQAFAPTHPVATTGSGGNRVIADAGDELVHAGAWCAGGALAGSKGGWVGAGLGCVGGASAALLVDLWDWERAPGVTIDPPPPPDDAPTEPDSTGPSTETQPDDGTPGSGSGQDPSGDTGSTGTDGSDGGPYAGGDEGGDAGGGGGWRRDPGDTEHEEA